MSKNKRQQATLVALTLGLLTSVISAAERTKPIQPFFNAAAHSFRDWPSSDEGIFPLGFSKSGWFAYALRKTDFEVNTPEGQCLVPPCYNASFMNIRCDSECYSDSPADKSDHCYCRSGVTARDFETFEIVPTAKFIGGTLPIRALDDEYSVQLKFVRDPAGGERGDGAEYNEVWLTSAKKGGKRIGVIHDHDTVFPKSARPIGWVLSPFENSVVVTIGFARNQDGNGRATEIAFKPIGANLESGFRDFKAEISFLLDRVETSTHTFVRNGEDHTGKVAASHMRRKYAHFESKIKSAEDLFHPARGNEKRIDRPALPREDSRARTDGL
jgi:hypothetical protein